MSMKWRNRSLLSATLLSLGFALTSYAADLEQVLEKGVERAENAEHAQDKIDAVSSDIRKAEREYRNVLKEIEGLEVYITQLDKQLADQRSELQDIESSINEVTLIERQITPLMLRMIDAIESFVKADMPFLKEERSQRVAKLKDLMGRSDVTVAEKYRTVMEAYQTEIEYGRTIEAYRGTLETNAGQREVDFLRIGRIALMYQSLNDEDIGVWNAEKENWQSLDDSYRSKVMAGIRIAREQAAPDLIKVPLMAPGEAE